METLMCDTCLNNFCECTCNWPDDDFENHLFEVDDNIQPALTILNQKGYVTRYSCSGHSEDKFTNAYIMFDRPYQFDDMPKGWRYDNFTYRGIKKEYRHLIRPINLTYKEILQMDEIELYDYLAKVNKDLFIWAEKLEECSYHNILPILPKSKYEKTMHKLSVELGIGYFPPYICS